MNRKKHSKISKEEVSTFGIIKFFVIPWFKTVEFIIDPKKWSEISLTKMPVTRTTFLQSNQSLQRSGHGSLVTKTTN